MLLRNVREAALTLAGALSIGSASGLAVWAFIEAVDHRGPLGVQVALATAQFVVPLVCVASLLGGLLVWHVSRKLYRGASTRLRVAARLGVAALLVANALGIVFGYLGWAVCVSSGTGCGDPTGLLILIPPERSERSCWADGGRPSRGEAST